MQFQDSTFSGLGCALISGYFSQLVTFLFYTHVVNIIKFMLLVLSSEIYKQCASKVSKKQNGIFFNKH